MKTATRSGRVRADPERQLRGFIANYNFFVIGYGPTERPSDCIVSMTAGANGVGLCFIHGASLPDPKGILLGSGRQTRFIRVESADVLSRPEVEALIGAAVSRARTGLSRQRAREAHHPIGVGEAAAAPQAAKMIG